MQIMLRKFVTEEGEPLLTPVGPFDAMLRLAQFQQATGIAVESIVTSPLCGMPVPLYPAQLPEGRRRWPGVRPEAMWHPLMWLPKQVRSRRMVSIGDGPPTIEDDDLWVARVMVQLATAAHYNPEDDTWIPLYDEPSGGWIDILALHNLNVETVEVQDRIAAWLDGAPDPDLDGIDLTNCFEDDEQMPDWAVVYAWNAIGALLPAAYAVHASALADHIDDVLSSSDTDSQMLTEVFRLITSIAADSFTEVEGEAQWWTELFDAWDGSVEQLTGRILPGAVSRLRRLTASMEAMSELAPADPPTPPPAPSAAPASAAAGGPDWSALEQAW